MFFSWTLSNHASEDDVSLCLAISYQYSCQTDSLLNSVIYLEIVLFGVLEELLQSELDVEVGSIRLQLQIWFS